MIDGSALGDKSRTLFSVSGWFSNVLQSTGGVMLLGDAIVE